MRSAGCIINDIIDINLDKKIKRTEDRVLTSKKITIFEACFLLCIFLLLSLLILLQFKINSILIALASVPLIVIYPFMKRYTYWPQLFLGLVFNWGILITSIEFYNKITINALILYIACIFWTLAYDTIYAYQDREDDIKNNIKSTAILFGNNGNKFVLLFYFIFFVILGFVSYNKSNSFLSLIIAFVYILFMFFYLKKWKLNSKKSSNYFFNFNNFIGLFAFIFLIIFQ